MKKITFKVIGYFMPLEFTNDGHTTASTTGGEMQQNRLKFLRFIHNITKITGLKTERVKKT